MNRSKKITICTFLFFLFLLPTVLANAYIAAGIGNNETSALQDAFRNALEKKFGIELSSKTLVLNNTLLQDQTFTRTSGMIKKYTILESHPAGNQYFVKTKVEIAPSVLPAPTKPPAPSALLHHMHTASIAVYIQDITMPQRKPDVLTETFLVNGLAQAGFTNVRNALSASDDADYLITGTSEIAPVIVPLTVKTPVVSMGITLNIQLQESRTGKTVFCQQYQTTAADVSKNSAVIAARNKIAPDLSDALAFVFSQQAADYFNQYTVHIEQYSGLSTLFSFRDYLCYLLALHDISLQSFNEKSALLTFSFAGDPDWLFYMLSQNPGTGAQIIKVRNHDIFITLP